MSMLPDLHLGAFVHLENDLERRRRNAVDLVDQPWRTGGRARIRIRASTFLARWILLGSYCCSTTRPTLRSLKRSRISETVIDLLPSYLMERTTGPLGHDVAQDPAGLAGFALQADIVETAGVPQRHEIAAQLFVVVVVALFGVDQRAQGILRHAPGAAELDRFDHVFGRRGARGYALARSESRVRSWASRLGLLWFRGGDRNGLERIRGLGLGGCCCVGGVRLGCGLGAVERAACARAALQRRRGTARRHATLPIAGARPVKHHLKRIPFHSALISPDVVFFQAGNTSRTKTD